MVDVLKHPDVHLSPIDVVTLVLLFALKGVGQRGFDRWLRNNYARWFPRLPQRTRLFDTHDDWAEVFLTEPTTISQGEGNIYGKEVMS